MERRTGAACRALRRASLKRKGLYVSNRGQRSHLLPLLQNQLATDLHSQAVKYSAQLPPTARDGFVSGFSHAVGRGLEVGVSQAGSGLGLAVFTHAFVDAMRISMLLPIAVIVVAAIVTFGVRAGRAQATEAGREAA